MKKTCIITAAMVLFLWTVCLAQAPPTVPMPQPGLEKKPMADEKVTPLKPEEKSNPFVIKNPLEFQSPKSSVEDWLKIVGEFQGNPSVIFDSDPVYLIFIYDRENPDPKKPVAIDVRNKDGTPILFYVLNDKEAIVVWQHPATLPPKIGI
jgi:hypothetical protein